MSSNRITSQLTTIADKLLSAEGPNRCVLRHAKLRILCERFSGILCGFVNNRGSCLLVLSDGGLRAALVRVIAVTLRYRPAFARGSNCIQRQLLVASLHCVSTILNLRDEQLSLEHAKGLADFAHALLRMQALHCASQHLAAASQHLRGVLPHPDAPNRTAAAVCGSGVLPPSIVTAADSIVQVNFAILSLLCWFSEAPNDSARLPFARDFAAALQKSAFLEHAAAGLSLAAHVLNTEEPQAQAQCSASAAGQRGDPESEETTDEEGSVQDDAQEDEEVEGAAPQALGTGRKKAVILARDLKLNLAMFCAVVEALLEALGEVRSACAATADILSEVLAGPCLQHLVAAVGICELHLTDGGPTFGLSPNPLNYRLNTSLPTPDDVPAVLADRSSWVTAQHVPICALLHILPGYSLSSCPLPGWRVACKLALRVAHAALGCAQVYFKMDAVAAAAGAATAAAAVVSGSLQAQCTGPRVGGGERGAQFLGVLQPAAHGPQRLLLRRDIIALCYHALHTAFKIQHQAAGAPGWAALGADRWRLTIAVMDCYLRFRDNPDAGTALAHPLISWFSPSLLNDQGALQAQPPPEVAAALEAGLLPFLERMLRRSVREPDSLEAQVLPSVLGGNRLFWYGHLIMYGDATQAASFTASFAKALRRGVIGHQRSSVKAEQPSPAHLHFLRYALLMLRDDILAAPALCAGTNGVSGDGTAGRRHGQMVSLAVHTWLASAAGTLRTLSQQQEAGLRHPDDYWLCLLYSFRCVLVLLRGLTAAPAAADATGTSGGLGCSRGSGRAHGSEARGSAAGSTPPPEAPVGLQSLSGGARAPHEGPAAPPSASDWRLQVLRSAEAIAILGRALRAHLDDDLPCMSICLADALCRAAVFMPEDVRAATREGAAVVSLSGSQGQGHRAQAGALAQQRACSRDGGQPAAGRPNGAAQAAGASEYVADSPASYWPPGLVRRLSARVRAEKAREQQTVVKELADALDQLAAQLESWAAGEDVPVPGRKLQAAQLPCHPQARAGALLLEAPSVMRELLGRCCANPDCINMEGDSEAGLRLQTCGRCGVVAYCGRDCQRAHWAAGHKAECGGRGDGKPVD